MSKELDDPLRSQVEGSDPSPIKPTRMGARSEVVPSASHDSGERERRVKAVHEALIEGEESGPYKPLDIELIITAARNRAGLETR